MVQAHAAAIALVALSPVTLAQSFEPFLWVDGVVRASRYYEGPMPEPSVDEVLFDAAGYATSGFADVGDAGEAFTTWIDYADSRPPELIADGYEWTFDLFAESETPQQEWAEVLIDFQLSAPARVMVQNDYFGHVTVSLGPIQMVPWHWTSGNVTDYYEFDTALLDPGVHRLEILALKTDDRGTFVPAEAAIWIRFQGGVCSAADLAAPFGAHDSSDIYLFIDLLLTRDTGADLNDDGIVDGGDVTSFIDAFLGPCDL